MAGRDWGRWERWGRGSAARLLEGEWTWVRALREAGYDTALIGKMHFGPMRAEHGFASSLYCEHRHARSTRPGEERNDDYESWLAGRGIVDWQNRRSLATAQQRAELVRHDSAVPWPHGEDTHAISWVRRHAQSFLRDPARRERPFALVVSFRYPHSPYNPVPRFLAPQPPDAVDLAAAGWRDFASLPSRLARPLRAPGRRRWGAKASRRVLAFYYALIRQVDEAVGTILEDVDLERTLVLFTSDHGDYAGWRGLLQKTPTVPFEALARVPLLAAGAGVRPGSRVTTPVALVDLAPTSLELAGQAVPADLDGVPLQRCLEAASGTGDRTVGCIAPEGWTMVRRGTTKYLEPIGAPGEGMLFDLSEDPDEKRDLAGDPGYAALREDLAAAARVRMRPTPSTLSPRRATSPEDAVAREGRTSPRVEPP